MEQINSSTTRLIWFQCFKRKWQNQIKDFMTTRTRIINEVVKEVDGESQQEASNNQTGDFNIEPSNEIGSHKLSLGFSKITDTLSDNEAYGFTSHGSFLNIDENNFGVSSESDHSSGISDTLKYLSTKFEAMVYTGKEKPTQNQASSNKNESLRKKCKDCENLQNSAYDFIKFFIPPKMPTEVMTALSTPRFLNAARTEKALYCAQRNLYLEVKSIIDTLYELNKIKVNDFHILSKVHFVISRTLYGILSSSLITSLRLSHVRRENVHSFLKDDAANIYNNSLPTVESLFG